MKHPKGIQCKLKSPGDWPVKSHAAILEAHLNGRAGIYLGHDLGEAEKEARLIRELLKKLQSHKAHPTAQRIATPRYAYKTKITQTGLQEWKVELVTGPWTGDWLNAFVD